MLEGNVNLNRLGEETINSWRKTNLSRSDNMEHLGKNEGLLEDEFEEGGASRARANEV